MFNFTTTTLINSADKLITTGTDVLMVKYDHINLKKDNVEAIYHAAYVAPKMDSASVTLPNAEGQFRLKLYISLDGNNNSFYANDMVYKGKPLYIEFDGKATAQQVATLAKKYQLLVMEKPILKLSGTGTALKIDAVDEHQRITKCVVEKFDETKGIVAGVGNLGMYVEHSEGVVTPGNLGKGTYDQILKDLRLPTYPNVRMTSPNKNEMPIPGAEYDQYTVYYCVNRGVMGGDAVGEVVKSRTCHVFFVHKDVKEAFETELKKVGVITEAGKTIAEDKKPISGGDAVETKAAKAEGTKSVLGK